VQSVDETERLRRIDAVLARAALRRLDEVEEEAAAQGRPIPADVAALVRNSLDQRLRALEQQPDQSAPMVLATQIELRRLMIRAEQEEILRIRDEEGLPDSIVRPIQQALDVRLLGLNEMTNEGHG
jgi:hypothetical protein